MVYDPFGLFGDDMQFQAPLTRKPIQPYSQQEEESAVDRMLGKAMGGIGYVGGLLDKYTGSRALRGLVGGRPEEALSLIPFSDAAGLTDEANKVTGEDLAKQWGLLEGEGEKGTFEMRDLVGPGIEMLMDPSNLIGPFGALKMLGRAAKPATALIPFHKQIGGALSEGADVASRYGKALFNKDVRGALEAPTQQAGIRAAARERELKAQLMGELLESARKYQPDYTPESLERVVASREGRGTGQLTAAESEFERSVGDLLSRRHAAEQAAGVKVGTVQNYWPRSTAELEGAASTGGRGAQPVSPFESFQIGREEFFRDMGRGDIENLLKDPQFAALNPLQQHAYIRQNVYKMTPEELEFATDPGFTKHVGLGTFDNPALADQSNWLATKRAQVQKAIKQAENLSDWVNKADPRLRAGTERLWNEPMQDLARRIETGARSQAHAESLGDLLASQRVSATEPGARSLADVINKISLDPDVLKTKLGATDLAQEFIPGKIAEDVERYVRNFAGPKAATGMGKFLDQFTSMFKAHQTAPWPGFHVRNLTSGFMRNAEMLNPVGAARGMADAKALSGGGVIEGASQFPIFAGKNLTDAEATRKIADMAVANDVTMRGWSSVTDQPKMARPFFEDIPGVVPHKGLGELVSSAFPRSLGEANPFAIAGVGGRKSDKFAPVAAGRIAGEQIEDVNRLGGFIGMLRRGDDPLESAAKIRAAHVDYGSLTPFEQQLRRFVPFYTYQSRNIPYTIKQLMERPSLFNPAGIGYQSTAARLTNQMRGDQWIPQYLGSGLAIPMGEEEDGTQRFLSRLDLPHEQAFENLYGGTGGLQRTAMAALGQLNPLLKAPLELATGKQFYSGRNLADLHPTWFTKTMGIEAPLMDQLLMNSPLARLTSVTQQLADPRKGVGAKALNILAGPRVTDVDMERQRMLAARDIAQQELAGRPGVRSYEHFYTRPEDMGLLTPDEIALLRMQRTAEEHSKRARENAAQGR